ncbi:MAG: disulfide bond formation protein B [Chlamydiales bacterium]
MHNDLGLTIKNNRFFLFVIAFSFFALCTSFSAEHLFKKIPCDLCKLERIPFIGMFVVGGIGFFNIGNRIPLFCLAGICLISLILGAYHFGIQQQIFTDQCKVDSITSLDDFKKLLHSPSSCSKVELSFFGIPAPLANLICSLGLFIKTISSLKISNEFRNKQDSWGISSY